MSEIFKDWVAEILALVTAFIIGTAVIASAKISSCGTPTHTEQTRNNNRP